MIYYLQELFEYLFGDGADKLKHLPSPNNDHHMGTEQFPYKLKHSKQQRRHAIIAGIEEYTQKLITVMPPSPNQEREAKKIAIDSKRKRLILIRTLHRNKESCHKLDSDVKWFYNHYNLDTSGLKFECSLLPESNLA
jgi:hypothetical protein